MKYAYTPLLYESQVKRLPLLGIRLFSGKKETDIVSALVDSGSDHSVLSLQLLDEIGIKKGEYVKFSGFGSTNLAGWLTKVGFRIQHDGRTFDWETEAIFSQVADRNVLGQHGFFEYFKVTFNRKNLEFELKPQILN